MENKLKEGFLRRLKEQGPREGWLIKWEPVSPGENGGFYSESPEFIHSFIKRKLKDRVTIIIEPRTVTYENK